MDNLISARIQMGTSLAFHIIFACIGMVMPALMTTSYAKYIRSRDPDYLRLTKMWMKGVAIFFAVGAVSGTLLSFELGLLWPTFMEHAGPIFGMPFSYEGAAFFLEAISLGIFLYGFEKVPEKIHWLSSLGVSIAGVLSGIFITSANSWMNAPSGFEYNSTTGVFSQIDPVAAMFNDAWLSQALHMILAAFSASSLAVIGVHSILLLKKVNPSFNKKAIKVALPFFTIASLLQPLSGDFSAKDIAKRQPEKLAAMEAHYETEKGAGLLIGGFPIEDEEVVKWGIKIPYLLSVLSFGDPSAEVKGLKDFPKEERPPVLIPHLSFQVMVAIGSLLFVMALYSLIQFYIRKKDLVAWPYKIFALCTPLGFIAIEAGWMVTEVGRQPWIIYKVMKTKDALTPMGGISFSAYFYISLYIFLGILVSWLFWRQIKKYQGLIK